MDFVPEFKPPEIDSSVAQKLAKELADATYGHMVQKRAVAEVMGYSRYYTGKSCKHGHFSPRYTSSGSCCECDTLKRIVKGEKKKVLRDAKKEKESKELSEIASRRKEEVRNVLELLDNYPRDKVSMKAEGAKLYFPAIRCVNGNYDLWTYLDECQCKDCQNDRRDYTVCDNSLTGDESSITVDSMGCSGIHQNPSKKDFEWEW